jgi:hypothetical protein
MTSEPEAMSASGMGMTGERWVSGEVVLVYQWRRLTTVMMMVTMMGRPEK